MISIFECFFLFYGILVWNIFIDFVGIYYVLGFKELLGVVDWDFGVYILFSMVFVFIVSIMERIIL